MPATVAPPPAPAAPKSSSEPAPLPTPPSGNEPVSFDAEIDADLASLDDSTPPAPPKPAAAPAKPAEPAKPVEPPGSKVVEPKQPDEPVKPMKAADLRGAYEGLKKKFKDEYEPELNQLRSKVKELEAREPEDNSKLIEEFESAKKRRDELESEIRFLNYQKSTEFQTQYAKPYEEAWKKAAAELSELAVTDNEGNTRTATTADLVTLANLPLGEARKLAKEMFGDSADDVMAHRRVIRELADKQSKALEDAKTQSGEREKQITSQRQIEHQKTVKLWKEANETLAKKYPNWFSPVEGDAEGNTLLSKGTALADLHFVGPKDLTSEQIEMLPPSFRDAIKANGMLKIDERVALDALLRNKIASHSRIAFRLKTANARIKELETSLAQYESSEPPAGKGGNGSGGKALSPIEEADAELDAIDRKNQ